MSKTFKCVEHEEEVLEVYPFTGDEAGRKFSLLMPHVSSNAGITFDSTTAPALALAILEAAGVERVSGWTEAPLMGSPEQLQSIAQGLAVWIEASENRAKQAQAKAQAKLEAEALELFRAFQHVRTDGVFVSVPSFASLSEPQQAEWLAVARRAREINKDENNA